VISILNEQHLVLNDSFNIEMSFEISEFAARKKYRADFSEIEWLGEALHESCYINFIHVCDMTHSCVWHDSFLCVT